MNILSLTHAHLNTEGLSPVSCERADSLVGTWSERLNWNIDTIHTKNTKWRGIWPGGNGLKINIIQVEAPGNLMMTVPQIFSITLKTLLAKKQYIGAVRMVVKRIHKRLRATLAKNGLALPHELSVAKKWGAYLSTLSNIKNKKYDYIFVCVGSGDEYLLQTGLILSKKLHIPMFVDLRDLWSNYHDPGRFTDKQRKQIRSYEKKLLVTTVLISTPQKHYITLLKKWTNIPLYHLPHSAYVGKGWEDGQVIRDEFRMLYAGKLYANGPGIIMLMELIKKLSQITLYKPFKCHFFVDDTKTLEQLAAKYGISDTIVINTWIHPWQLWKNTRSAHLLVIIDSATEENHPLLLTKTFQCAYSGQQLLCLQQYNNIEMQEFLDEHNAGATFTDTDEAKKWIVQLSAEKKQYESLPPLRNIPMRENVAEKYGREIEMLRADKHKT